MKNEEKETRKHRNRTDYGIADYRKFYTDKYSPEMCSKKYAKIIKEFNEGIKDLIVNESIEYTLPFLLLEVSIRKVHRRPKIVNGKLVNNRPINWKATNDLWNDNEEAKEQKLLVRFNNHHTSGYVFRIYMKKFKSKIPYRSMFKMIPNRQFKIKLKDRINNPEEGYFDSFLLYKDK